MLTPFFLLQIVQDLQNAAGIVNSDHCWGCGYGGDLVCCEGCAGSWHICCMNPALNDMPEEDEWYCVECVTVKAAAVSRPYGLAAACLPFAVVARSPHRPPCLADLPFPPPAPPPHSIQLLALPAAAAVQNQPAGGAPRGEFFERCAADMSKRNAR